MPNTLQLDPTRTTLLRRQMIADMERRFKRISKAVYELIMVEDAFGFKKAALFETLNQFITNVPYQAWAFRTSAQKVQAFRAWLQQQINAHVLTPIGGISGKPWMAKYIESAYRKGMTRAYTEVHKADLAATPQFYAGGKAQFLRSAFAAPETLQKIELLFTRAFTDLNGVTDTMSQQLSRILANGLAHGRSPLSISREMRKSISKLSRTRARTIARTEIIAAHAEGQLDAYDELGIEEVGAEVEWTTAGDQRVCPDCEAFEAQVFKLEQARGMIPLHPNCRCSWLPVSTAGKEKRRSSLFPKKRT